MSSIAVMSSVSRHISIDINADPRVVYDFAANPANLPKWASGLAGSEVTRDGDHWSTQSPMGAVAFTFAPDNEYGVLDHEVTLPSGETTYNPMRVIRNQQGSEVIFSLRRGPGMSEADFERDAEAVTEDLATLKSVLET